VCLKGRQRRKGAYRIHKQADSHLYKHAQIYTHTHLHTHSHSHTCKHTHKHKHMHTQVFALHPGMVLTDVTRSLPYLMRKGNEYIMGLLLLTPSEGVVKMLLCMH